jgi:4a-hydroxytetrahydrobiopterin dehydratase
MNLGEKKCKPCEGGIPALEPKEVEELRVHIKSDWKVSEHKKLIKEYSFVIDFVDKAAQLAEQEGHHPVMHVYYGRVVVELWTHAIEGLSENDFIMAYKIDKL